MIRRASPEAQTALFALYEAGAVTPVVSAKYPLPRAAAALAEIASRRSVGKVVLTPGALSLPSRNVLFSPR